MSWKEGFYEAVKQYCDLPNDAVVTSVEEEAGYYYTGCDTCGYGGGQDFEVNVYYYTIDDNVSHSTTVSGKLGDFIESL